MQVNEINNKTNFAGELSQMVTIIQKDGIHGRPAKNIIDLLKLSDKDIFLYSKRIPSKKLHPSLFNILMLELRKGETIELVADEKYPKGLFKALGECFGAKNLEESKTIAEKYINHYHNKK